MHLKTHACWLAAGLILLTSGAARGQLSALYDASTPVPGGAAGEVFSLFGAPSLSADSVAFFGRGDMGMRGVYTDAGGALAAVADTSTPVPGGAAGEVFTNDIGWPSLSDGSVAFVGRGDMGAFGVYTDAGGALAALADTSTPVPGGVAGEVFNEFDFVEPPSLFAGSVAFIGSGDMGTRGVYTGAGGALAAVADTSTPVPGGAAGEVFFVFDSPSLSGGSVAFIGSGDMGTRGVYTDTGGALAAFADVSTPVPGGAVGEVFFFFFSPSLSAGRVAFAGFGDMGTRGIYTDSRASRVADTSTPVPGGAAGEVFNDFTSPSLSAGRVAFLGFGDMGAEGVYIAPLPAPLEIDIPTLSVRYLILLGALLALAALPILRRRLG